MYKLAKKPNMWRGPDMKHGMSVWNWKNPPKREKETQHKYILHAPLEEAIRVLVEYVQQRSASVHVRVEHRPCCTSDLVFFLVLFCGSLALPFPKPVPGWIQGSDRSGRRHKASCNLRQMCCSILFPGVRQAAFDASQRGEAALADLETSEISRTCTLSR